MSYLVDSHCHLDFPELVGNLDAVLALMTENDVRQALCVSVSLEAFPDILKIAEAHDHIYASVGVHPDGTGVREPGVDTLVDLARHPKVIGIGETGLDYYRLEGDLEWQRDRFRTHIRAARETAKPLIIHTRAAAEDTLKVMREEGAEQAGGVMHCFTESWEVARAALDLGFYISFSGIVTFRNAEDLREVARKVPLDRMLIETDSPYLAPVPFRGKTNQPGYVKHTATAIAALLGLPFADIARRTTENFHTLFKTEPSTAHA